MDATPTAHGLPLRLADFSNLTEALDYAAQGKTGYNFYNGRGKLESALPYAELRDKAQIVARRLQTLGLERGARVALVADTYPGFLEFFFGCQYLGLVPVPLPAVIYLGGGNAYISQLRKLLINCQASVAIAPAMFLTFLTQASQDLGLRFAGTPDMFAEVPQGNRALTPSAPDELAYLQYTSGSTQFPRGVMIKQETVMNNLSNIIRHGVRVQAGDRGMSWLPYYHDMGLVGLVLAPMASQRSVDYLPTRDFAMRPRMWLSLMTENQATLSFSPPFGYELCLQRLREEDRQRFDLRAWRLAGVGAETIRPEPLNKFAEFLEPCGFKKETFVSCYGMAECSLAVSFAELSHGIEVDCMDAERMASHQEAVPVVRRNGKEKVIVNCGAPLPGYEIEIRDQEGRSLPERHCGTLFVKGASVMSGYFGNPECTRQVLSPNGWLNTGDLAYRVGNDIFITGRGKDLIIVNGRNIWPQDMEYLAELQPEVRAGDASAFSVTDARGEDAAVLVIECRESNSETRAKLIRRLSTLIRKELGIDCLIELVPRNTLPRTTSGKLSRSAARKDYLQRVASGQAAEPGAILELTRRAV
jgi:fatty-acyl-CoA synthase